MPSTLLINSSQQQQEVHDRKMLEKQSEKKIKKEKKNKQKHKEEQEEQSTMSPVREEQSSVLSIDEKKKKKKEKKEKKKSSKKRSLSSEEEGENYEQLQSTTESTTTTPDNVVVEDAETTTSEKKKRKKLKESTTTSKDNKHDESTTTTTTSNCTTITVSESSPNDTDNNDELNIQNFGLSQSIQDNLLKRGIAKLFPIQAASFQHIVQGKDLVGRARTGTGKTLAFALPMVEKLTREAAQNPSMFIKRGRSPKILVMAPTRELAGQVAKEFESIMPSQFRLICIYGGVPYDNQYYAMKGGVDIVVGTPGRLIDHVNRGNLKLDQLFFVCLDEADQMLDIGFAEDMDVILAQLKEQKATVAAAADAKNTVPDHQVLLFSATLPEWIQNAIKKYMKPNKINVDLIGNSKMKASESVQHLAIPARWENRADILGDIVSVYGRGKVGRTIIFVETKKEANELVMNEKLKDSQVIHGDIVQKQREISMQGFRDGKFRCLIATNVCARGVDIPEVDLVINCEPPGDVESYIHRSGRTGRAGKTGVCVTFYKPQQEYMINVITKRAGVQFKRIGAPQPADIIAASATNTVENLTLVDKKAMTYFTATAQEVLEAFEGNAQKAVEACLAMICGTTKALAPRSLLTAAEGYVTLHFQLDRPIRSSWYVTSILGRMYPELSHDDTRGWRMTLDEMGVVVDINASKCEEIVDEDGMTQVQILDRVFYPGRGVTVQIAKELPPLKDYARGGQNGNGGGRFGNGNRSNGRSSSYQSGGGQRSQYNQRGGQQQRRR